MTPDQWSRVAALFTAITESSGTNAETMLDRLCGPGESDDRRRVERLLRADRGPCGETSSSLDRTRIERPSSVSALSEDERPSRRAGEYRLLRPIGRGAQSVVYLAVRDDDAFRQRVAVKLIRRGVDDPGVMRRFLAERQILAGLEHPNIARLYGGGTNREGRPYLVMEYIEGLEITTYCDRHALDLASRLRLFLEVCDAVQFAHQSLLVHRDIKPGNILVTTDGVVKLLDFGIAKALAPRDGLETRTTETGSRPMTPRYASPEQVRGGAVTMATDVYALGVLLYELVCGARPYTAPAKLPHELALAICEGGIRPASATFNRTADAVGPESVEERARLRAATPAELRRRLRGDLDTILARALRKRPERRYPTALHLAEDIRRHLADRPIHARQDHVGYRLGKLYRRHRTLAASLGAAALLVAGLGGIVHRQASLLESSRLDAERVTEVFVDRLSLDEGDPDSVRPVPREALDASLTEIAPRLGEDRRALARMLETMGWVYRRAGLAEDALWLFEESLEQYRLARASEGVERKAAGELGDDDARASAAQASASHALGTVLLESGRLVEGERELRRSIALHRATGEASYPLAEALETLARHRWTMADLTEAEALLLESLEVRRTLCDEAAWTAGGMSSLAGLYLTQRRVERATPLMDEAEELRAAFSERHRSRPRTLEDRAALAFARSDLELAETLFRQALADREERFGPYQREVVSDLDWLARILIARGRPGEAVERLRRAVEISDQLALGSSPQAVALLKRLGRALDASGESEAAEQLLRQVIALETAWFPDDHPSLAVSRLWLGRTHHARGEFAQAEALYREAAAVLDRYPDWDFGLGRSPRVALERLDRDRVEASLAELVAPFPALRRIPS